MRRDDALAHRQIGKRDPAMGELRRKRSVPASKTRLEEPVSNVQALEPSRATMEQFDKATPDPT